MQICIVIPARYGSTRFPGKPLAEIAGKTMLQRVSEVAQEAASSFESANVLIATEDTRIETHAKEIGVDCVMTPENCKTGSDRALTAIQDLSNKPEYVINLQGDAPFTPVQVLSDVINALQNTPEAEIVTPVHQLSWDALDALREAKTTTPFSGTTVTIDQNGKALWFSKNIIPAIRKEDRSHPLSPVFQHIGLYGFKTEALEKFCALPTGNYEVLEGLEQLRLLENGIDIYTVQAKSDALQAGIDTPEDLKRAEAFLQKRENKDGQKVA